MAKHLYIVPIIEHHNKFFVNWVDNKGEIRQEVFNDKESAQVRYEELKKEEMDNDN